MAYYRIYFRDGPKGRFVGVEDFHAASDEAALQIAETHSDKFIEVWQETRCIATRQPIPAVA